ncbi:hypothetical protein [Myroides odoratimimus]|uniref:Uncharacterized protein n=1 Tax=Myroides odoratimimus CIP 101113 TaxID=883154 RepID=A0AAV3F1X5_9FLAO|nr:hypothetical protein [Myroides odoratimimus]EHO11027.1 hypothetical protein HMPREF9715_02111 [Myroides odoratimimus CIP 101113]
MQRLLPVLFLLISLFISCSNDDNTNTPSTTKRKLIIETELATYVNKPIYFTVKDLKGNIVTEQSKIIPLSNEGLVTKYGCFKPTAAGKYQFIAKAIIQGFEYENSDPITITVKEPKNKVLYIDQKIYPIDKASLSITRQQIKDSLGNDVIVDKVVSLTEQDNYNEYILTVVGTSPVQPSIKVTFLVPNESIKLSNGTVTDYGQRVLPHQVGHTIITQIIANQSGTSITIKDIDNRPNSALAFHNLNTPKPNHEEQILERSYFGLETAKVRIDYIGDLIFTETIE